MTDGRFETTINMRPDGWDTRRHWTKTHKPFSCDAEHVRDHMERESCPFHDLRADGCFQPEYAGLGIDAKNWRPDELVKRPDGNRFATAGSGTQHRGRGIGGFPIAHDVEPAPQPKAAPAGGPVPWRASSKKCPPFSGHEHMADAVAAAAPGEPLAFFHTGKAALIGAPPTHYPEPYKDPTPYGRKPFRLAAGVARRKDVIGPAPPCPPPPDLTKARRAHSAVRSPLQNTKSSFGTFSHYPTYIPDPVPNAPIRSGKPALFTYAAKTKRSMPLMVPWQTGTQSSEVPRPPSGRIGELQELRGSVTARGRPNTSEIHLLRIQ